MAALQPKGTPTPRKAAAPLASDRTSELDEQEKDGLPGRELLHRQPEQ